MKTNKNVTTSLNTNPKEDTKMNNTNYERISTETELLSQLMGNLNNKEETKVITKEEKMEIMQEEAKAIQEEEMTRELNHIQELNEMADKEMEDWAEEVFENPVFGKNTKEETEMKKFHAEVKDFETGHIGRGYVVDEGNQYLVHPYMLEIDINDGHVSCRHYAPYTLSKEWEGWEYTIFQEDLQEELVAIWEEDFVFSNNKEEELEMDTNIIEMDLQFFAIKEEEETEMLKQIQKFNDIAKQIEEIDETGGDVYIGGVNVSWDSVKQFVYGLSDEELEFLAYSNKPEIPAEMEVFAIYLLEAEKAWDNEISLQNAYFSKKENLSLAYSSFHKGGRLN